MNDVQGNENFQALLLAPSQGIAGDLPGEDGAVRLAGRPCAGQHPIRGSTPGSFIATAEMGMKPRPWDIGGDEKAIAPLK
jgi:hypothetical protein